METERWDADPAPGDWPAGAPAGVAALCKEV